MLTAENMILNRGIGTLIDNGLGVMVSGYEWELGVVVINFLNNQQHLKFYDMCLDVFNLNIVF